MGKDAGPAKKGGKTIGKTKVAAAEGESSTGVAERAGDAHGNEPVEPMATTEAGALQELGGLAREMEDQLLREFETLLAKRKRRPLGTATNGVGPEGGSQAGEGGRREDDPTYWKHMYEKLRDARETEAEKLLREMSSHAEQRERLVQDLMTQIKAMQSSGAAVDPTAAAVAEEEEGEASGKQGEEAETSGPSHEQLEQWRAKEEELEAKIVRLKRLVLGYQRLTSICLSLEEEPPATANAMDVDGRQQQQQAGLSTLSCTAINHLHKRAVRFSVQLDCDGSNSDDVLQADAHFRPLANKALLPAYLREEVSLETRQCPLLLLSVLKTLYSSKDPAAQAAASSSSS